jgi:hypothetical protein
LEGVADRVVLNSVSGAGPELADEALIPPAAGMDGEGWILESGTFAANGRKAP